MFKKVMVLAFAGILFSNVNAASVTEQALVPQTEEQRALYEAGQQEARQAVAKYVEQALAQGQQVTPEGVLAAAEASYRTVALRNNEKAIWFALGAVAGVAGYFVLSWGYNKFFSKSNNGGSGGQNGGQGQGNGGQGQGNGGQNGQ